MTTVRQHLDLIQRYSYRVMRMDPGTGHLSAIHQAATEALATIDAIPSADGMSGRWVFVSDEQRDALGKLHNYEALKAIAASWDSSPANATEIIAALERGGLTRLRREQEESA